LEDLAVDYAPPRRFQHRYFWPITLFLLTLITTTVLAGLSHYVSFEITKGTMGESDFSWGLWRYGLYYSIPLLVILGCHEFGHYWYCRKHQVDASLPYFLPAPIPLTGTLGAVIRIKEAFPSKQALFDIGVAGPIAGFAALLPFLYWGMAHSATVVFPEDADLIYFGEPLLLKALAWWHFGELPEGMDLTLHPVGFAAWFGMLATALNLFPFGQLDGGHIAYAVFGPRARYVSLATLVVILLLTFQSPSWIAIATIMLAMAFLLGLRHPRIVDEHVPLDGRRKAVALLALGMFIICFTPVPIETFLR